MAGLIPSDAVAIGLGAFFGAMSRYQAGRVAAERIASDPNRFGKFQGWHTAAINIGGSFLLGAITGAPMAGKGTGFTVKSLSPVTAPPAFGLTPRTKLLMGVGFCGSFTTFSTYSVDIVGWLAQGQTTKAFSYIMINQVGGIAAAAGGMVLVKKLFG
jgi:CrcB protein